MRRQVRTRRLQRISAKEDHAAFILATWRDVQKGEHVDEWAQAWRSCCMKLVYLANDSEAFWHHVRSRERIGEYLHRHLLRPCLGLTHI